MIFLAKIPGHLEDHTMAKTNGSRDFSDLLDAIQIVARRPMSQVSSSFPSYDDEWDDGTNATEYYDIDDHNAIDNDGYYDEYDEVEDYGRSKSRSQHACLRTFRRAKKRVEQGSSERQKGLEQG